MRTRGLTHAISERWFKALEPSQRKARVMREALVWVVWTAVLLGVSGGLLLLRVHLLRRDVRENSETLERARAELREQGVLHGQILDAISDLIVVRKRDGAIVWANRAYREFHGIAAGSFVGDPPAGHAHLPTVLSADDAKVFESERALNFPERELTCLRGGRALPVETSVSPVFDAHGAVVLAVSVSRDASERKAREALIAEQRQKILSSAKMTALGEMSGGIAHEINNPLTVIYGFARVLQTKADAGALTPEAASAHAAKILATTERISRIVKALKSFARDAEGDPSEDTTLGSLVEETLDFCQERFKRYGASLEVSVDRDLTLRCRTVQVSQILLNLLNNAFDATDGCADRRIRIVGRLEDDDVVLEVRDSGPGVSPQLRETVFQPFFTTKDVGKGTGLGLSVSKGLAEGHGGSLACIDVAGECVFVLRLPRKGNEPRAGVAA